MKPVLFQVQHTGETAFKVRKERGHMYPHYHAHDEMQCTWIEKGHGLLIAGDAIEHFNTGDVFLLNSFVPHVFRTENRKCSVTHIFFSFKTMGTDFWKLNELATIVQLLSDEKAVIKMQYDKLKKAVSLISQMKNEVNFTNLILFVYFLSLFADKKDLHVISGHTATALTNPAENRRMSSVIEFTLNNFSNNITLKQAASVAGMSIPTFCRYFKKSTDKPFFSFLNEVRISKARRYLHDSNDKVESIAYSCGFSNLSYFNRVFKQHCGMSPKEYRKNISAGVYNA